jgi:hypothetical protein
MNIINSPTSSPSSISNILLNISKQPAAAAAAPIPIYSPPSSVSRSLSASARLNPPKAARIIPKSPTDDLSQHYDLLPQKYLNELLALLAIHYITKLYDAIYSFASNITDILQRVNDCYYINPKLFKKEAIDKLLLFQSRVLLEQYKYTTLSGTTIDISDISEESGYYKFIELILFKKTIKERLRLYDYLRSYLYKVKEFKEEDVEKRMRKLYRHISVMKTDASIEEYMLRYFSENKVVEKVIAQFKGIDITTTNIKLESQYKTIKDLIDIINDIWVNEKAKERFIKYILKSQGSGSNGSSGSDPDRVRRFNSQSGGAKLFPTLKMFRRVLGKQRQQPTRVMPEQISVLNKYKRSNNTNFQNIYAFISLLSGYILEVDAKMRERFAKEYDHLYEIPKPLYNDNLREIVKGSSPKSVSPKIVRTKADIEERRKYDYILNSHLEFNIKGDLKNMEKRIIGIENNFGI